MVISRFAGSRTSSTLPSAPRFSTPTFRSFNSGRNFAAGSEMSSLPSSASIITATETIGLVIEAMRKIESGFIGIRFSRSWKPIASCAAILPSRTIIRTAPGSSPASTRRRSSPANSESRRAYGKKGGYRSRDVAKHRHDTPPLEDVQIGQSAARPGESIPIDLFSDAASDKPVYVNYRLDLSAEMVALMSAKSKFSANLKSVETAGEEQKSLIDLMA